MKNSRKKILFFRARGTLMTFETYTPSKTKFQKPSQTSKQCFIFIDDHQPLKKVKITKGPKI